VAVHRQAQQGRAAPRGRLAAQNAFPVKVEGPGLKASGNEVAIESIEIAHEGLELQNG